MEMDWYELLGEIIDGTPVTPHIMTHDFGIMSKFVIWYNNMYKLWLQKSDNFTS